MAKTINTDIALPELDTLRPEDIQSDSSVDHWELRISTSGSKGRVYTCATAERVGQGVRQMTIFEDYRSYPEQSRQRATQKAIDAQHAQVMTNVDAIKREAIAHYQD